MEALLITMPEIRSSDVRVMSTQRFSIRSEHWEAVKDKENWVFEIF